MQTHLKAVSVRLAQAVEIILLLLKIRFSMADEEHALLRVHLSPHVDDESELGWEDVTYAALGNLLKTCLSKGKQSAAQQASG